MKHWLSIVYLVLTGVFLQAQSDSTQLNAAFRFADGVYYSFAALAANQPEHSWAGVDGEMIELAGSSRVQIAGMGYQGAPLSQSPYAISLDGKPYLFVKVDSLLDYHEFAGLRKLGRYSYFEYERKVMRGRTMYAYNPANGLPFRQAYVEREEIQTTRVCLDMQTGRQFPLQRAELLRPLRGEPELIRAINQLRVDDPQLESKLLQAVVRYNERHPVFLPTRPFNR
ncbi:MAG: hypothetical protein AAF433_00925 [Bacteroidota bacterium]